MTKQEPAGVLLLLPHLDLGGGARRIKTYCDNLDRKMFVPCVCIFSHQVLRDLDGVIGKNTPRLFSDDPEKIKRFCRKNNVQAVYTFYDGQYSEKLFTMLSRLRDAGVRIITNNVFAYYDKRMDDLSDLVLFQTKMMLAVKFARNFPKKLTLDKYKVLPNPVNTKYFRQFVISPEHRSRIRARLGFQKSDTIVARFGRNDVVKWGDILTGTMLSPNLDDNVKFLIVGIPKSRKLLLKIMQKFSRKLSRRIVLREPTKDDRQLMQWVQAADIIGHGVKIGEGCSNAINEAMYWGKPVITNSTPHCDNGQIEQVDHNITGFVANTVPEWVEKINQLNTDLVLRQKLGLAGKKKAEENWNEEVVVSALEYYLGLVLGTKIPRPKKLVTPLQISRFEKKYNQFIHSTPPRPASPLWKLLDVVKRTADYIEYKVSNA